MHLVGYLPSHIQHVLIGIIVNPLTPGAFPPKMYFLDIFDLLRSIIDRFHVTSSGTKIQI